jgi:hypothetical protein
LRANLYWDPKAIAGPAGFAFNRENTTGKEVMDAFLAAYSDYTRTQDQETGVLWLHPKKT